MIKSLTLVAILMHGIVFSAIIPSPKILKGLSVDSSGFIKINETHMLAPVDPAALEQLKLEARYQLESPNFKAKKTSATASNRLVEETAGTYLDPYLKEHEDFGTRTPGTKENIGWLPGYPPPSFVHSHGKVQLVPPPEVGTTQDKYLEEIGQPIPKPR